MNRINKIMSLALNGSPIEHLQENISDNLSSTSMNVSGVSSEVTEEQLQVAQMLDELLTPSDLGFQSHDFLTGHETLVDEEDIQIPEPTEAADFSSDDSVVDRTYAPEIDSSSSSETSLHENDHHNVEVTKISKGRPSDDVRGIYRGIFINSTPQLYKMILGSRHKTKKFDFDVRVFTASSSDQSRKRV
ncbi:unnamed protein product [Spodoptera exigua]|nr:unnamed protein product [Spodoptera exigua]